MRGEGVRGPSGGGERSEAGRALRRERKRRQEGKREAPTAFAAGFAAGFVRLSAIHLALESTIPRSLDGSRVASASTGDDDADEGSDERSKGALFELGLALQPHEAHHVKSVGRADEGELAGDGGKVAQHDHLRIRREGGAVNEKSGKRPAVNETRRPTVS